MPLRGRSGCFQILRSSRNPTPFTRRSHPLLQALIGRPRAAGYAAGWRVRHGLPQSALCFRAVLRVGVAGMGGAGKTDKKEQATTKLGVEPSLHASVPGR